MDYVRQGDFTVNQAMEAVADILFNNSNRLYGLDSDPGPLPVTVPRGTVSSVTTSVPQLDQFLRNNPDVEFIWAQFVDYTATVRVRMLPVREFRKIVRKERRLGIPLAVQSLLQDDHLASGATATGQFYMQPDLSSLCRNAVVSSKSATVMSFWLTETGHELEGCPRTTLQNIVNRFKVNHGIDIKSGFKVEIVFLKPVKNEKGSPIGPLW